MTPSYTHDFEFRMDDFVLVGETEFNLDGQASFETDTPLPNITIEQHRQIYRLFDVLRQMFVQFGDLDKIEIIKK